MAKKKKTDREKMDKIRKASRRKALMDEGLYMIHKEKVVDDKTKYNRKKNKPPTEEEE